MLFCWTSYEWLSSSIIIIIIMWIFYFLMIVFTCCELDNVFATVLWNFQFFAFCCDISVDFKSAGLQLDWFLFALGLQENLPTILMTLIIFHRYSRQATKAMQNNWKRSQAPQVKVIGKEAVNNRHQLIAQHMNLRLMEQMREKQL